MCVYNRPNILLAESTEHKRFIIFINFVYFVLFKFFEICKNFETWLIVFLFSFYYFDQIRPILIGNRFGTKTGVADRLAR
jgi:hypothetical protein